MQSSIIHYPESVRFKEKAGNKVSATFRHIKTFLKEGASMIKKEIQEIESHEAFQNEVKKAQEKLGREMLSDNDLFVLTCEKIVRTYTFEEKGYN
jgi:hypothetical protein